MKMSVYRKAHFNAAHRIHNPNWTDEKNKEVFGPCSNPNYHGHNYDLTVKVTGEIDPETGYVIDLKIIKKLIEEHVVEKYDHKNLNVEVPDFETLIPTAEHICYMIWKNLRAELPDRFELKVRLYETPRNFVEYPA